MNDTLKLNKALVAENITFPTYVMLKAIDGTPGLSVSALSLATGYSYWATRNQIRRTSWFKNNSPTGATRIQLNADGVEKLRRIKELIA